MTVTLALYIRISNDPLALRAGVERQLTDCQAIARTRWPGEPTVIFEDNDRSAYRGKRPAFTDMRAAITSNHITGVIGWDLDRMFRQPRELEAFIDLCDARALTRVVTAKGDLDLTSHDGQLHARILVAVARKESDDKSRRIKRAALDRAENGHWHGGPTPYGYQMSHGKLSPDPSTAPIVLEAARVIARGGTLAAILRASRERGHGPNTLSGWRYLLTAPSVTALTRLHGEGNWPAIVPRDTWLQVQDVFEQRRRGNRPARQHWVTGILTCAKCQSPCVAFGPTKYACQAHGCASILRSYAEPIIEGMLFEAARVQMPSDARVASIEPVSPMLATLAVDYAEGRITRAEWLAVRSALIQPESSHVPAVVPVELAAVWPKLGPAERVHAARQLLVRVELSPAHRRHVEPRQRLHPVWV